MHSVSDGWAAGMGVGAWTVLVQELIGTALLLLLGTGVVANVVLRRTTGHAAGTLMVNFGWGFAVFAGASVSSGSGAHLNPAVTLGFALAGGTPWRLVPVYLVAQFGGAVLGTLGCWLAYRLQLDRHERRADLPGVFVTAPTIANRRWNLVTEAVGTFVLMLWILLSPHARHGVDGIPEFGNSALGYAGIAFLIIGITSSLGGPTGCALNPARDLGARLTYAFVLPLAGKPGANWGYAWIPVAGPLCGAALAAGVDRLVVTV